MADKYPIGVNLNSTQEASCKYVPGLTKAQHLRSPIPDRTETQSRTTEAVSRLAVADQQTCSGLSDAQRLALKANIPWVSFPKCVTIPRQLLQEVSRPTLASDTLQRTRNTCFIALGDSTMTETVMDFMGFLGSNVSLKAPNIQNANQSAQIGTKNQGIYVSRADNLKIVVHGTSARNYTVMIPELKITVYLRFIGHPNKGWGQEIYLEGTHLNH